MTQEYDAIVIGSGLGGLTAGALYARAGAKVLLLERNVAFGGAATTYRHGNLTIEASLHETTDPRTTLDPKGQVFEALDLYTDIEFVPVGNFYEVRSALLGEPFTLPDGYDAIEKALIARFPHQEKGVKAFLRQMKRSQRALDFLSPGHNALWRLTHIADLPLELWSVIRDMRSSLSDVFQRYFGDDEAIKFAIAANLSYYTDDPDSFWWLGFTIAQSGYMQGGGHYIKGGSGQLSNRLAEIIREEGGETLNRREAISIDVGEDGVKTVRHRSLPGGEESAARAPVIFANAAPHKIAEMLPEDQSADFMAPFRDKPLSISLFSATLGLDKRPADLGLKAYSTILIPDWMEKFSDYKRSGDLMAGEPDGAVPAMAVIDYSRIESGLPEDKLFPVSITCVDREANWRGLDKTAYQQKRSAWLDVLIKRLDAEWPGFAAAVKEKTISTARTMKEYLNTPEGAIYGFALTPPKEMLKGPPEMTQTSVDGLWIASAYGGFGGFTGAMGVGAEAAREALRQKS